MGFQKKSFSVSLIFILLFLFSLFSNVHAEISGPGWIKGEAELVSHEQAAAYYSSQQSQAISNNMAGIAAASLYVTEITPEIKELARALHYDPKLIFEYVHNHVDYVWRMEKDYAPI